MPPPDDLALNPVFDPRSVQRGRALHRSGAVLQVVHDPDEETLHALVQGTRMHPYEVEVYLDDAGAPEESGCSCPVGSDCKHAVAAWLAWREEQERPAVRRPQPGGTPVPPPEDAHDASPDALAASRFERWWERWEASLPGAPGGDPAGPAPYRGAPRRSRIYAVGASSDAHGVTHPDVHLTLLDAPRTAAGTFNKGRRADPDRGYASSDTDLDPADREIEALGAAQVRTAQGRWARDDGRYALRGRIGRALLDLAVGTGRCFVEGNRDRPLTRSDARALSVSWRDDDKEGGRRLVAELDGLDAWWAVATDPPCWIDPRTSTFGAIDTELDGAQLRLVLDAPPAQEHHLQTLAEEHAESPLALLPPPPVPVAPLIEAAPAYLLVLASPGGDPHVDAWTLALYARYGDVVLPCDPHGAAPLTRVRTEDGSLVRVRRDPAAETRAFFEVMRRHPSLLPRVDGRGERLVAEFAASGHAPAERFAAWRRLVLDRDALERDGWTLIVRPPVRAEPLRPGGFDGLVERAEDAGPGWFDVSIGFEIDGVRHDLVPLVAEYVERGGGDAPLVVEVEGGFVEVPAEVLRPVAEVFVELDAPPGDGTIRLSRARALALEGLRGALDDAGVETRWRGEREPFELARRLRELADVDVRAFGDTPVPRALEATLRPYQRAGLGWLNALASLGLCGVLADDMGLGKTVQTLAHVLWLRQGRRLKGPVLVVAPTSLLGNWANEAARFAPRLRVRVWHGTERRDDPLDGAGPPADLVVTTYALALRDAALLAGHGFDMLVLDEAQQIRNPSAKTTRALKALPIERRLSLSGTPLENHLGELWSQFDFLMPGLLGDRERFNRRYRTPIERHGDTALRDRLAAGIAPFLLRRTKEQVATDLPPKTEMRREVVLGDAQAKLYESIRASMRKRVREALRAKGLAQSRITVLDALLKLRQLCCHPQLLKLDSARRLGESAKTTLALDMIDELIAEGRRVLLFSSFTSMLSILEAELAARGHRWVKLTGQTRKRDAAIDAFQRGDVPLFLISLKAGGTGLNLTAADTVIHYDPWWNPAAEAQASARAHRIGQDKPVFVYRLVTAGTVEERIVSMQDRKRDLAAAMIEGGDAGALSALSTEETLALFDD